MSAAIEKAATPRQVGVYRLDEKIGSGAMGTVYRATHTTLGKSVALKLVRAEDPEGEMCQRFLLEGVAASRVRHPNVVEVLDAGVEGDIAYLAMQLLEGETLAECLAREGRLTFTYAIDLILPVCAALMAAHDAGVLHRDLKPDNVFLADVGRGEPEPMLLDFGISKIMGPVDIELTQNPKFLGTPLYIAPEQADGAPGSELSDQYSLALSLYEALLGVRPFEKYRASLMSLLRHVAEGEIRPASELDASIPVELSDAIARAVRPNPKERFESVREFGATILPFASEARRVLWQHAFIDAERTMASANAPVSHNPSGRRVSVSVEEPSSSGGRASSAWLDDTRLQEEFLSHSKLFGDEEEPPEDTESAAAPFNAERSSISRRPGSLGDQDVERDDPESEGHKSPRAQTEGSDVRSEDPLSDRAPWSDRTPWSDRNSVGVIRRSPPSERTRINNRLVWTLSAILALTTIVSTVILLRHELTQGQGSTFLAEVTVHPATAEIELDGQVVGHGHFVGSFPADGRVHQFFFREKGYEPLLVAFRDSPPPEEVRLKHSSPQDQHSLTPPRHEGHEGKNDDEKDSPAALSAVASEAPHAEPASRHAGPVDMPSSTGPSLTGPSLTGPSSTVQSATIRGSKTPTASKPSEAKKASAPVSVSEGQADESRETSPEAQREAPPENASGDKPQAEASPVEKPRSIHTGNLNPWAD